MVYLQRRESPLIRDPTVDAGAKLLGKGATRHSGANPAPGPVSRVLCYDQEGDQRLV